VSQHIRGELRKFPQNESAAANLPPPFARPEPQSIKAAEDHQEDAAPHGGVVFSQYDRGRMRILLQACVEDDDTINQQKNANKTRPAASHDVHDAREYLALCKKILKRHMLRVLVDTGLLNPGTRLQ
jgi:hypothetical protein